MSTKVVGLKKKKKDNSITCLFSIYLSFQPSSKKSKKENQSKISKDKD